MSESTEWTVMSTTRTTAGIVAITVVAFVAHPPVPIMRPNTHGAPSAVACWRESTGETIGAYIGTAAAATRPATAVTVPCPIVRPVR